MPALACESSIFSCFLAFLLHPTPLFLFLSMSPAVTQLTSEPPLHTEWWLPLWKWCRSLLWYLLFLQHCLDQDAFMQLSRKLPNTFNGIGIVIVKSHRTAVTYCKMCEKLTAMDNILQCVVQISVFLNAHTQWVFGFVFHVTCFWYDRISNKWHFF